MRVLVSIDGYTQIYEVYSVIDFNDNGIQLTVKNCHWRILVRGMLNSAVAMEQLLMCGWLNLSKLPAEFIQEPFDYYEQNDSEDYDREINLNELIR